MSPANPSLQHSDAVDGRLVSVNVARPPEHGALHAERTEATHLIALDLWVCADHAAGRLPVAIPSKEGAA